MKHNRAWKRRTAALNSCNRRARRNASQVLALIASFERSAQRQTTAAPNAEQLEVIADITRDYMERGFVLVETQTDVRVMRRGDDAASAAYVSIWVDASTGHVVSEEY